MIPNRMAGRVPTEAAVALAAGAAAVAGSYAAAGFTPAFVVAPVEAFLTRTVPDAVLRFAITTLGTFAGVEHFGQLLNLALAAALSTASLSAAAFVALLAGRRFDGPAASVALVGGATWAVTAALTGRPTLALGAGVGGAATVAIAELAAAADDVDPDSSDRRRVLGGAASALGAGVAGYLLGRSPSGGVDTVSVDAASADSASVDGTSVDAASDGDAGASSTADDSSTVEESRDRGFGDPAVTREYLSAAADRSLDVDGLEGLVSDDFYQVDIGNVDPDLTAEEWSLSVTGAVESEAEYDFEALRALGDEQRFVTLRCVSDPINGKLMDTDLWTGVPVSRILDAVNPRGEFVMLRAADDYYEEFPVEALEDAFLAYGKRGAPLPRAHGHPVRALVPGHWGEINVKWVTEMEILDGPEKGFWEKRGWHGTGPVNTVAKLHATTRRDGEIRVGGHAYAGTRGVERVEVSTDGGESWTDATLSDPLPAGTDETGEAAEDAWQQWAHAYENPGRRHTVVVRATDGTGTVQPREADNPYPSGATGWVSKTIRP